MKNILLALCSGLLLSISWPAIGDLTLVIFVSFVPLLILVHKLKKSKASNKKAFSLFYLAFLVWNSLTTWWIYNASGVGAGFAILANSALMALVFFVFFKVEQKYKSEFAVLILIPFWVSWEYFHMHWDLSWPWLTLGNVFSNDVYLIQWYEYTGHLGGSIWILLINSLAYIGLNKIANKKPFLLIFTFVTLFSISPYIISKQIVSNIDLKNSQTTPIDVLIIQPNIDPYFDKFNNLTSLQQINQIVNLAEKHKTPSTTLLVGPETSIPKNIDEKKFQNSPEIEVIDAFVKKTKIDVLTGLSSYRLFRDEKTAPTTAREFGNKNIWLDFYNTGALFSATNEVQLYHKSKLVPGVEKMPFGSLLKPLEKFAINLGGTTGSLGIQKDPSVFQLSDGINKIAPIICYESIYGEYIGEYVNLGATVLAIITNDGWWRETPGYKQHLAYGRLRAIEHRKPIIRAANTGISCFIDIKGNYIYDQSNQKLHTKWWTKETITNSITPNNFKTFYTLYGNYLAKISCILTILLLITMAFFSFQNAKQHQT